MKGKVIIAILFLTIITGCYTNRDEWVACEKNNTDCEHDGLYTTGDSLFYIHTQFDKRSKHFFSEIGFLTQKRYKIKKFNIKLYDYSDTLSYKYLINQDWGNRILFFDSIPNQFKYTGPHNDINDERGIHGGFNPLILYFTFHRNNIDYVSMPNKIQYFIEFTIYDESMQKEIEYIKAYEFCHILEKGSVWL